MFLLNTGTNRRQLQKNLPRTDGLKQANALIKTFCDANPHLYFIDSGAEFLGKDGKPITTLYRDDKLHYNEAGYKVWGKNIARRVNKISKNKR